MNEQEIWVDVPNYEGLYQVSNYGKVKSLSKLVLKNGKYPFYTKEKIMSPFKNKGYDYLLLVKNKKRKLFGVHQIVAMGFLNHQPNNYEKVVNHKDSNTNNNNLNNLEVISQRKNTSKENIKKASKYVGVHFHKPNNKWQARIYVNGKRISLGYFEKEDDAGIAYQNYLKTLNV